MPDEAGRVSLGLEIDQKSIGKQMQSVTRGIGQAMSKTIRTTMSSAMRSVKPEKTQIDVDTNKARAEMERLTAVLDNTNAQIRVQEQRLNELRQSYAAAVSPARKNKLQEDILKTEARMLRLTKTSDDTSQKLWKLEDSMKAAGDATKQVDEPVKKLDTNLKRTNKTLNTSDRSLKRAAFGAGVAGKAFLSASNRVTNFGNQFTQAFSRIAKQVLVFAVLYKAIRGFQNYMGGSLKTNDEFVRSLNAIRTNLAVAFQPIFNAVLPAINAFMSALARITAYIAAFMSALFGTTYKQSFEAAKGLESARKGMEGYGAAAKKAGKDAKGALAGFDEVNQLAIQDDPDIGGAGGLDQGFQIEMPEMDTEGIQAKMDVLADSVRTKMESAAGLVRNVWSATWNGIKAGWEYTVETFGPSFAKSWKRISPELVKFRQMYADIFNQIIRLGEPLKLWVVKDVVPLFKQGIELTGNVLATLIDIARRVYESVWNAAFPFINKFITDGLPRFTQFLSESQKIFYSLFETVGEIFTNIWQDAVDPAMQLVSDIITDALDLIHDWWDEWGVGIVEGLKESLDAIKELWNNLWQSHLKPLVDTMLSTMYRLWDEHLKDLIKEIGKFVGTLVTAAQDILNKFIMPIINWLVQKLGPVVTEIFRGAMAVAGELLGAIIDTAKHIISALGGIIEFLAGVFTGDWKRAWNGIKTFFQGIGNGIVAIFKGVVNTIIETMNWMIRQLNKIKIDMPDWVESLTGYRSFGINIPEIPKLAKGGLVSAPTLAMVGDNRGASVDPEVVSPLSKLQEMLGASNEGIIEVLLMILAALEQRNQGGDNEATFELDGTVFARLIKGYLDQEEQRIGTRLVTTS